MTYIKRLKIKGFKSFAEPISFTFEPGFNTIIGANGSGKSNVFDALCFVLGRMSSKGLRAEKLGNLVFNGGKDSKPAKEAVVELFLDNSKKEILNSELEEVKITRVVSKDGSSKYYFNNRLTTRTEILSILNKININPDGYNIVLQGDINRIVNMTNIERRILIEEIANLSVYEEKREKSLKKLEEIEGKLKEADLLLEEKTKYINELKSEKELAEKFYTTKRSLLFNNTLLIKAKTLKNALLKKNKEEQLKEKKNKLDEVETKLDSYDKEISKLEDEINKHEKRIELESQDDFIKINKEINNIENEIKNLNEKKNETKKIIKELEEKKKEIKLNIEKTKKTIEDYSKKLKEKESEKKKLENEVNEYNKKLDKLKESLNQNNLEQLNELDKKLKEIEEDLLENNKIKEEYKIHLERLNTKLQHFLEEKNKIEELKNENKKAFEELEKKKKKLKKLILDISELTSKESEVSARINNLQKEFEEAIEKQYLLKSKTEHAKSAALQNRAIEEILKFKNRDENIYGTVAELGSVDEKYSLALEVAGGSNLFNIVVENEDTAIKYIKYLKEKKIGTVTFLPLNKIKVNLKLDPNVYGKDGVIDYAVNIIKADKKFENIFNLIFGDTLIIESIDYAKKLGIGKYRIVTLDGDYISKTGALSGGFRARKQSKGLFKNEKLLEELEEVNKRIEILKNSLEHLKEEKTNLEEKIYTLRKEKSELEGEVIKIEKSLELESKDTDSINKDVEFIKKDKKVLEENLKKTEEDIKKLLEEKEKLENKKEEVKSSITKENIVEKINKVEKERDKLNNKLIEIKREIDNLEIQVNSIYKQESDNLNKNLKATEKYIEENKKIVKELSEKINKTEEKYKELKKKEKVISKDYKGLIEKRDSLKKDKKGIEEKYNKIYTQFTSLKEDITKLELQIEEYAKVNLILENELATIFEEVKTENNNNEEKLNKFMEEIEKALKEEIDIKSLQNKVNALKAKLNSFGSINLKAIEIYDQLSNEYNELLKKRESLNKDKSEILKLINELDIKKKEIFLDAFHKLNKNFNKVFKELSNKGDAELVLENEKNIFENGVQIRVRISKTNYLDIKSLSGGEKSLTALAFLFAVQEFNPASFYIFDEVDAALDNFNSEKLGELINNYSKNAQYIVVSHNENLVKSAEIIYGITMNKKKVSEVVSLKFSEITKNMLEE